MSECYFRNTTSTVCVSKEKQVSNRSSYAVLRWHGIPWKSCSANRIEWCHRWILIVGKLTLFLVRIHWKLSKAHANVIFFDYRWFHLNFLEQLPLVEQYHSVNYSATWLCPERVIGQQLVSHDLFLILWRLLRYDKSTSSNELNSPNYLILFSMVFELFLCGFDGYSYT